MTMRDLEISVEQEPVCNQGRRQLIGGYVEFSLGEFTHEHFFTSPHDLSQIGYLIDLAKLIQGLKQFIKQRYMLREAEKQSPLLNRKSLSGIRSWNGQKRANGLV
jgi:hypothetical protein